MRYLGGKHRLARSIAGYLNSIRLPGQPYWEPFVGGGWILERIRIDDAQVYASDAHPFLIAMWRELQLGKSFPKYVTREMYETAREQAISGSGTLSDGELGFIGFCASFGGKWFGGWANPETHPSGKPMFYTEESVRTIRRQIKKIPSQTLFFCADFIDTNPPERDMLIYCDPPYEGTTSYKGLPEFNNDLFWEKCRSLSEAGHFVVISEYNAPSDFSVLQEVSIRSKVALSHDRTDKVDKLYCWGDRSPIYPRLL